jgi:hypothetical protein
VTLSSITACITPKPAPTASANRPSLNDPASSAMASVTLSGMAMPAAVAAAAAPVW